MKIGDLVEWAGKKETGLVGIVIAVDAGYIYVRWADGHLDDYQTNDEVMLKCLKIINENR